MLKAMLSVLVVLFASLIAAIAAIAARTPIPALLSPGPHLSC